MNVIPILSVVLLLLSPLCLAQLPSSRCDSDGIALANCTLPARSEPSQAPALDGHFRFANLLLDSPVSEDDQNAPPNPTDRDPAARKLASPASGKQGFHWRSALRESFTFLVIEQAYVVHSDFGWVVVENGVPFNHYWRDYTQSLSSWIHSGWNDGDPNWYGYVGHPVQGALTGFIQIQNDPQGEKLEFSKTKAYWWSRLKAGLWNAAYSTQWNLGPLSEVTVEKYGTKARPPWNYDGSYPCSHHCLTGVGQIDIVMTPLAGTGWLIGEDFLDKNIVKRVENSTQNRFLIDSVRCALNPIRGGANILHGKHPWYRASRDTQGMSLLSDHVTSAISGETTRRKVPEHGNFYFGYSHMGPTHCQFRFSEATAACNPESLQTSNFSGWNGSIEKKYLRYFGAVADFGGQYGPLSQSSFLFGLRGSAAIGRFQPFAQALVGAVHTRGETGKSGSQSYTSFAEDLGVGIDSRMTRLLSWRIQADEIETWLQPVKGHNTRLSSGLVVRF